MSELVSAAPQPAAASAGERTIATTTRRRGLSRRVWIVVLAIGLVLALDLARSPSRQLSARGLIGAIHLYQVTLSPRLGAAGVRCRFKPSCSHYAEGAIRRDGALVGSARAAWRIARCGPWTPAGTYDPP
ncbi:MAG TPA: membrane protein insertion efficiency factor YidD [Thermoanaerobaculia bacterium]|nr:membrane protein insertion efficiency factor YidD [Thermoanaerobaculia bacterium]